MTAPESESIPLMSCFEQDVAFSFGSQHKYDLWLYPFLCYFISSVYVSGSWNSGTLYNIYSYTITSVVASYYLVTMVIQNGCKTNAWDIYLVWLVWWLFTKVKVLLNDDNVLSSLTQFVLKNEFIVITANEFTQTLLRVYIWRISLFSG